MHNHTDHPEDHTEREEIPFPLGYTDPYEQTGSDDEVRMLEPVPVIPISSRSHRWRMFRDEYGRWKAMQPEHLHRPMFTGGNYGFTHHSPERVMSELQLAVLIAKSYED